MSDPKPTPWQESLIRAAVEAHLRGETLVFYAGRRFGRTFMEREVKRRLAEMEGGDE